MPSRPACLSALRPTVSGEVTCTRSGANASSAARTWVADRLARLDPRDPAPAVRREAGRRRDDEHLVAVVDEPVDDGLDGRRGAVDRREERLGNESYPHARQRVVGVPTRCTHRGGRRMNGRSAGEPDPEHRLARSRRRCRWCRRAAPRRSGGRCRARGRCPCRRPWSCRTRRTRGRRRRAPSRSPCRRPRPRSRRRPRAVVIRRVPSPSIASTALSTRLVHTWFSSPGYASMRGSSASYSRTTVDAVAELVAEHHERALQALDDVDRLHRGAVHLGVGAHRTDQLRDPSGGLAHLGQQRRTRTGCPATHSRPGCEGRALEHRRPPARTRRRSTPAAANVAARSQPSVHAVAGEPVGDRLLAVRDGQRIPGAGARARSRGASPRAAGTARWTRRARPAGRGTPAAPGTRGRDRRRIGWPRPRGC